MTEINITEIAAACAVLTCGGDAEEFAQEAPPPALMSIGDIESMFIVPTHAPYKDEDTAKYERKLNGKDDEIDVLEGEINSLQDDIDDLQAEVKRNAKADKAEDKPRSDNDTADVTASIQAGDKPEEVAQGGEAQGQTFEATYYSAYCDTGCSGVTATGIDVSNTIYHDGKRVIAVDPSVIPLGSTVKVTTPSGTFEAVSADTGGDINGNRIDILVESTDKAYELGRHKVTVEIIG